MNAVAVAAVGRRLVVGIGDHAVSGGDGDVIVTHALGSCIAVCIWDPVVRVAGMLHFLLPEATINPERARTQPATFADTGLPLLFMEAYALGLQKGRTVVKLIGGADIAEATDRTSSIGRRNIQMARQLLWKNGYLVRGEAVGGKTPRSVALWVSDGQVQITTAGQERTIL